MGASLDSLPLARVVGKIDPTEFPLERTPEDEVAVEEVSISLDEFIGWSSRPSSLLSCPSLPPLPPPSRLRKFFPEDPDPKLPNRKADVITDRLEL